MTEHFTLDPRILGQILLLQSSLYAAPDEIRLGEQVCYTLASIPGISASALHINEKVVAKRTSNIEMLAEWPPSYSEIIERSLPDYTPKDSITILPLQTRKMTYGNIVLAMEDNEVGSQYLPFLENTANQIALLLENRKQEVELRKINVSLEEQVHKRTQALAESERLFRSTFESAAIGMCLTGIDGYLKMANPVMQGNRK